MNHNETYRLFVKPLLVAFDGGTPGDDPDAFFKALCDDLSEATEFQLTEAVKLIRRARKARSFPTIGDCLAVVKSIPVSSAHVGGERQLPKTARELALEDPNSHLRMVEGDELCRSFRWSREAAKQGWLLGLWDFCRDNRRHPDGTETQKIKRTAKIVEDRIADMQTGKFMPTDKGTMGLALNQAGISMGLAILDKRDAIVKRVFPFGVQEVAAE